MEPCSALELEELELLELPEPEEDPEPAFELEPDCDEDALEEWEPPCAAVALLTVRVTALLSSKPPLPEAGWDS